MRFFTIFTIFLLSCGFSGSCGASQTEAIDTRTDYLLGALLMYSGSTESCATLLKFFTEVRDGALTESYKSENLSKKAQAYILGWEELHKKIEDSLEKMKSKKGKETKFKKNEGKDLALYLANQFGVALWHRRGYSGTINLLQEQDLIHKKRHIFPTIWGKLSSDIQCGQLFRGIVEMHWDSNDLGSILLRVIRTMDRIYGV